jgi:hypothetical protein
LDCGGKRSATPLWDDFGNKKAVSSLRSATALQKVSFFAPWRLCVKMTSRHDSAGVIVSAALNFYSPEDSDR